MAAANNDRALQIVDNLAEDLMLLDHNDRAGMDLLVSGFYELLEVLPAECAPQVREMVSACARTIKRITENETLPSEGLTAIGQALKYLQPVFRDNLSLAADNELLTYFQMNTQSAFHLSEAIDPQMYADFLSTQPSNLDDFEEFLVKIERDKQVDDTRALRRLIHTLKGETGLLGINEIQRLCHVMEDNLRDDNFPEELFDDFYEALDWLRSTFTALGRNQSFPSAQPLTQKFEKFSGHQSLAALEKSNRLTGSVIPNPINQSTENQPVEIIAQPESPEIADDSDGDPFAVLADIITTPAEPKKPAPVEKTVECKPTAAVQPTTAKPAGQPTAATTTNPPKTPNLAIPTQSTTSTTKKTDTKVSAPTSPTTAHPSAPATLTDTTTAEKPTTVSKQIAPVVDITKPAEVKPTMMLVLPENVDKEVFDAFLAGQSSNMDDLEQILLQIERGETATVINSLLGLIHTLKGDSALMGLIEMERLCHTIEDSLVNGFPTESSDVFFAALDWLRSTFNALGAGRPYAAPTGLIERFQKQQPAAPLFDPLTQLAEKKITTEKPVILNARKPPRRPPPDAYPRPTPVLKSAAPPAAAKPAEVVAGRSAPVAVARPTTPKIEEQRLPKAPVDALPTSSVREMVRVDADRLDRLLDTIGEIVIAESMVAQSVHKLMHDNQSALMRQIGELGKITRTLQETGMSLRMMSIRGVFNKMDRLVRDLSHKSGKTVRLVTVGEDTELDKSLIERISDLLVHMVRNSMDHGIEDTLEDREKAEKPREGKITLHAYHKGGNVCLDISDDGRGLDREAIFQKAIERGVLTEDDVNLSDSAVFKVIFESGFSTAKKVTDISGRGVGMDVVKRNVDAMRGRIEIFSTPKRGTKFSISLPLTLAIIDGMVVRVAKERYIVPTLSIVHSVQIKKKDVVLVVGKGEMICDEGMELPMFRLSSLLDAHDAIENVGEGIVLIVETDGRRLGVLCDEILEQQQIVIKSLGEYLVIPGIAGGAIMPDGLVGLIIDIGGLLQILDKRSS